MLPDRRHQNRSVTPLSPPSELAYQINDSRTNCVIALSDLAPKVTAISEMPDCMLSVIVTSAVNYLKPSDFGLPEVQNVKTVPYNSVVQSASEHCEQTASHHNDTFMVQYTDGTTGRPKGAQLYIRNINPHFISIIDIFDFG